MRGATIGARRHERRGAMPRYAPASARRRGWHGGGTDAWRTQAWGASSAADSVRRLATIHDRPTLRKYSAVIGTPITSWAVTTSPGVMMAVTRNTITIAYRHC